MRWVHVRAAGCGVCAAGWALSLLFAVGVRAASGDNADELLRAAEAHDGEAVRQIGRRYDASGLPLGWPRQVVLQRVYGGNPKTGYHLHPVPIRRISDHAFYRALTGWNPDGSRVNHMAVRPLDPEETRSPADHFAINLAAFLLDADYGQRRPAYNYFF